MNFLKIKRTLYKNIRTTRIVVAVLLLLFFGGVVWFLMPQLKTVWNRAVWPIKLARGELSYFDPQKDRINILVLGMGGNQHTAPDLTDTMILTSISTKGDDVAMISLPRDLWSENLQAKINTAYHYGNKKTEETGLSLAKKTALEVSGQKVDYALVIDLKSFERTINLVGGVEVYLEKGFTDEFYPIPGKEDDQCNGDPEYRCRFETLKFDSGWHHLDGKQALKFVRSRHAQGPEGTDFARSRRQQMVITALKDKVLNLRFLASSQSRVFLQTVVDSIETDIPQEAYLDFLKLAWKLKDQPPRTVVIPADDPKTGEKGVVYNPDGNKYDQWVLVPKKDWQQVHDFVSRFIKSSS